MILKKIFINEKEIYLDLIIKELCKYNIPYLYIKESNEIHFDKYIIRFYNIKEVLVEFNKHLENSNKENDSNIVQVQHKNLKLRPNYKNNSNKILKKQIYNRNNFKRR